MWILAPTKWGQPANGSTLFPSGSPGTTKAFGEGSSYPPCPLFFVFFPLLPPNFHASATGLFFFPSFHRNFFLLHLFLVVVMGVSSRTSCSRRHGHSQPRTRSVIRGVPTNGGSNGAGWGTLYAKRYYTSFVLWGGDASLLFCARACPVTVGGLPLPLLSNCMFRFFCCKGEGLVGVFSISVGCVFRYHLGGLPCGGGLYRNVWVGFLGIVRHFVFVMCAYEWWLFCSWVMVCKSRGGCVIL